MSPGTAAQEGALLFIFSRGPQMTTLGARES